MKGSKPKQKNPCILEQQVHIKTSTHQEKAEKNWEHHITENARVPSKAILVKTGQNQLEYVSNRDQSPANYQDKALAERAAKLHILLAVLKTKHLANVPNHGNIRTGMGKLKLADFQIYLKLFMEINIFW